MKVNELIKHLEKLPQDQDISLYIFMYTRLMRKPFWMLSKIEGVGNLTGKHKGLVIKGY